MKLFDRHSIAICILCCIWLASCGKPPEALEPLSPPKAGISDKLLRQEGKPLHNLEQINDIVTPYDPGKQPVVISSSAPLTVNGWAVDSDAKQLAAGVEIVVDGRAYQAEYNLSREDVANSQKVSAYGGAGFRISIPVDKLPKGEHSLAVRVISANGTGFRAGDTVKLLLQ
jgi:hypothetical protein